MYGVKLEPEYVNIVYTVVVVAIIWTYYWTIGRRIDRDAFLLPGKMSLVVAELPLQPLYTRYLHIPAPA